MMVPSEYPNALKVPTSIRALSMSRFMVLTIINTAHRKKRIGNTSKMGSMLFLVSVMKEARALSFRARILTTFSPKASSMAARS